MNRTGLPIELGPVSNGEYAPPPPGPIAEEAAKRAMRAIDDGARRTGMSRRRFLQLCGTATVLSALAACSREQAATEGTTTTTSSTTTSSTAPGGTFELPPESTTEPEAAAEALGGFEGVIDVQTHLLEFDTSTPLGGFWGSGFPQASCGLDDPRSCFSIDQWMALVLDGSDTSVAVLSAVPIVDDDSPLSTEVMERARREAEAAGCDRRVLIQGEAFPTVGEPEAVFDGMAELATSHDLAAWKTYTHVGDGWFLDDREPGAPQVGQRFLDQVRASGTSILAVHKGFGTSPFASPVDVGPAAAANPDLTVLVYHSGYQPGVAEGAYDQAAPNAGIDRLIASVEGAGIGPEGNVYAELGSTWFNLLRDPTQAAHALGKLLVAFGPERILWGTDSLWYGSPQPQIEAFRAFEISTELQETHGYPALTDEVKALILGGNAARLHGIEPLPCPATPTEESAAPVGAFGPSTAGEARATFLADHPWWSEAPA
ncbi:MAG: amidohydrolase family protein [Actinomycetota bacterium]